MQLILVFVKRILATNSGLPEFAARIRKLILITHQRKKGTLGITGLFGYRVPIDIQVWHLDVGSSRPLAEEG